MSQNTSTGGSALASNWTDPNAIPINRIRRNKQVVFDMSFWQIEIKKQSDIEQSNYNSRLQGAVDV